MKTTWQVLVGIFARTFAVGAGAVLIAAQGYSWATTEEAKANALVVGLGLLAAAAMAVLAVFAAIVSGPATTRWQKSVRSFLEKIVAGVGVVAFNEVADVVAFGKLFPPLLIAAVLAFAITWLSYQAAPVVVDRPAEASAGAEG